MKTIEYRVRPITRFIVTRYVEASEGESSAGSSEELGEFKNREGADRACHGMFFAEKSMASDEPRFLLNGSECAIGLAT